MDRSRLFLILTCSCGISVGSVPAYWRSRSGDLQLPQRRIVQDFLNLLFMMLVDHDKAIVNDQNVYVHNYVDFLKATLAFRLSKILTF